MHTAALLQYSISNFRADTESAFINILYHFVFKRLYTHVVESGQDRKSD